MGEHAALGARATWLPRLMLALGVAALSAPAAGAAGLVGARAASRVAMAANVSVDAVRLESAGQSTKLIFDLSDTVEVRAFPLANPDRIVVDLREVAFHVPPMLARPAFERRGRGAALPIAPGLITSYRFGQFAPGHSRVIIDLKEPARIVRAEAQAGTQTVPARLVIELVVDEASVALEQARDGGIGG